MMTKICILSQWMDTYGGLQKVVCNVANALSNNDDFQVTVCTVDNKRPYFSLSEKIVVVNKRSLCYKKRNIIQRFMGWIINKGYFKCSSEKLLKRIYFPVKRVKKLETYIKSNGYDVVIAVAAELSMLLSFTNTDCKKIGWQHNDYLSYFRTAGKYNYGLEKLATSCFKLLDANVVLNRKMKEDYYENMNIESIIIHNPVSFKTFIKSKPDNKTLLYIGRLVRMNKGLDYLKDILCEVLNRNSGWSCVVVGDGVDKCYLENELANIKNIKFVGEKKNVVDYYLKSSIMLNTSRWEGQPLTILEAMECGTIPISFDIPASRELIDNETNGILVEKFSTIKYIEKLEELMNNDKKRVELSKNSIAKAKEFDIDTIEMQWKEIITK